MKKLVPVVFLSMLMVGCGGGDSSSGSSQNNYSQRVSSKTQLSVDAADLQELQNVKYASNDGIAFSTPENFQK
ncbi:hypothetical protein L4D77_04165 [Photobacterium frigidiphilum]|uniref:hypothetical protein n=1 Tax=Photobacterium frigidiphilum TaxID=264736 RepID=UPI003D0CBD2B